MTTQEQNHAQEQARMQLANISEMIRALANARQADGELAPCDTEDTIQDRISETPLDVMIRSHWHSPGTSTDGGEFNILLCTGGPAVRLIGEYNKDGEPDSARIEYQDWGTPWTQLHALTEREESDLLMFCTYFNFTE